jgi:SpoIIAA-like
MLKITADETAGLAVLEPDGALSESDFKAAAEVIDPLIERGHFIGLIISAESFPGWDSFGAVASHIRFVRNHHKRLQRVALVTDSHLGDLAEKLASHFVSAEIKHFPFGEIELAKSWVSSA